MAEFRTTFVPKNPDATGAGSSPLPSGVPIRPSYAATHRGTFGLITVVLVVLLFATLLMGLAVYGIDRSHHKSLNCQIRLLDPKKHSNRK